MILEKIILKKREEIKEAKSKLSLEELIDRVASFGELRGFKEAISKNGKLNLIAEIKKASPSKGLLRENFNPVEIAEIYQASGADCLSVLTDKAFFQGDLNYLKAVRQVTTLPILRKDFIIDKYQIYESLMSGADAILLISQLLSADQLHEFYQICQELNLDVLCEVHNEEDLDKALKANYEIIGINNRNLQTFQEDLEVTTNLIKRIPQEKVVVSESAIKTHLDIKHLESLGVRAVLIGEAFMRSENIEAKVREVMGDA